MIQYFRKMGNILYYIYLLPLIASAVLGLKAFRPGWPRPYRYFSVFLLVTLFVEVFAIVWKWWLFHTAFWHYSTSNLWIYNIFLPVRYLLLLAFFHGIINSPKVRLAIRWVTIPFVTFSLLNYFLGQTPHRPDTYTIICCHIMAILLSLAFFYQIMKAKELIRLKNSPAVWISLGIFIYHSGTLPLFVFFDYLISEHLSMALSYFYINDVLNILMCVSYLIAFICRPYFQRSLR